MGNSLACFHAEQKQRPLRSSSKAAADTYVKGRISSSSSRKTAPVFSASVSTKKEDMVMDDPIIKQQALAAALLLRQHQQQNGSPFPQFDRSTSVQYPLPPSKDNKKFPRSASTRPRSVSDALTQSHLIIKQGLKIKNLETRHFVLVHGGGFGAWCWYKAIALLKDAGFEVDAIDLTGSGVHSFDTNNITGLAQYVKPLTDFLENLEDGKKVILVGHDLGGTCMSYAMELHPSKVAKAVYVAATMLNSGQSTLEIFSLQRVSNDLMQRAQKVLYANGNDHPPTAIDLDKQVLGEYMFNRTPSKDLALASVSMRPVPFAPVTEKLFLSKENYGSVQRFYIKTEEDYVIPVTLQEAMIKASSPEQVFQLKGSDHSPFFSKPQTLHKLLVEISNIPS